MAPQRPRKVPAGAEGPREGAADRGSDRASSEPASRAVAAALDRLFAAPFDQFVALRREAALALRKDGDAAGARAVTALAKPSRTAWALNQVARRQPDLVTQALDAWARAAASPKAGDAADVRATARAFRDRTSDIVQAAEELTRQDGAELNVVQGRRIAATLQAIAGGPDAGARERLVAGRLATDVDVDDPFAGLELGPREASSRAEGDVGKGTPAQASAPAPAGHVVPARDAAVVAAVTHRAAAEAAERGRLAREREREKRAREIEAARSRVTALETEAREARAAAREAEVAASRAQADAERARRAVEAVERKLEEARGELRSLGT